MRLNILYAGVLFLSLASCNKSEDKPKAEPTILELTLKDEQGNVMTGGQGFAFLYTNTTDWSKDQNKIGEPRFADASGKITITGLEAKKYYWRVEDGCRNNFTTSITTPLPLTANTVNKVDVPMTTSFSLKLRKRAAYESSAFGIYINDGEVIYANSGLADVTVYKVPPHSKVRVLQISGITGTAIDTTYNEVSGQCGESVVLDYPE